MNKLTHTIERDNKFFITEVDEDMENVIFKVVDKINNEYIMIVNDANRYEDFLSSEDQYNFLHVSTYQNIIDYYCSRIISDCKDKIEELSK